MPESTATTPTATTPAPVTPTAGAPEDLSFAYWVPNVSGGLVVSTIDQRTDHTPDYNREVAQAAERVGFD